MDVIGLVTVLVTLFVGITSFLTALRAAKQSTADEQEKYILRLEKKLEDMEARLLDDEQAHKIALAAVRDEYRKRLHEEERKFHAAMDWAGRLVRQLRVYAPGVHVEQYHPPNGDTEPKIH